jgi:hypothetical protein
MKRVLVALILPLHRFLLEAAHDGLRDGSGEAA